MNYKESIAKFAELASKFKWEKSVAMFEHCWSDNREKVDEKFVTDDILEKFGNRVKVDGLGEVYAFTVDGFLYMGEVYWFKQKRIRGARVLLRRANWDNIIMQEDGTLAFKEGGDES